MGRKRTHRVQVRLNDEEYAAFKKKVELAGCRQECFLRNAIANKNVVQLPPVDYGKLIFETRRVGQNVNRLLRIAYANNYFNTQEIKECLEKIRGLERKIHIAFFETQEEGDDKKKLIE